MEIKSCSRTDKKCWTWTANIFKLVLRNYLNLRVPVVTNCDYDWIPRLSTSVPSNTPSDSCGAGVAYLSEAPELILVFWCSCYSSFFFSVLLCILCFIFCFLFLSMVLSVSRIHDFCLSIRYPQNLFLNIIQRSIYF